MVNKLKQQSRQKRNKIELYYAVLRAIRDDQIHNKYVRPTRIQFLSGTSYEKLILYLDEMKEKKLVKLDPIIITKKGEEFMREYTKINQMTEKLGLKFIHTD